MKKIVFIIILLNVLISCQSKNTSDEYLGTWQEVQQKDNSYVFIDCGYEREIIKVSNDSIYEIGAMENLHSKIDHIKNEKDQTILFIDELEKSYFKFSWIDKKNGISKWEVKYSGNPIIIKYYINKLNLKNIKVIKGNDKDCITNKDVGDLVSDSLKLKNGNKLTIEDENCISLKDKKNNFIIEKCFENNIIRIRLVGDNFLPLTFINGQNSMDIDFFNINNNWTSKSITYYKNSSNGEIKKTQKISISLKEFNFENVAEKFDEINNDTKISFEDIKNKQKLTNMDVYQITDILEKYPISIENITTYNDAAFNLIEVENYNQARIILLDIVSFSPDRVVAYLNLGDAQWGFDDVEEAKKAYQKYISLMKSQGKDLKKIPQRIYERIK